MSNKTGVERELLLRIQDRLDKSFDAYAEAADLRALLEADQGEQVRKTYLVGYGHPRGSGRSFVTFEGIPTAKDIEELESLIQARNNLDPVSITSISLLGGEK